MVKSRKHMIKEIVRELYPLYRTLVHNDTDKALKMIGSRIPASAKYSIECYAPMSRAWTWQVPPRYEVDEAYIELEDGRRVADFNLNPMHLVSYSVPIQKRMTWDELKTHLHYSEKIPSAIPWQYAYYVKEWGFSLTKNEYDRLPRKGRFHVVIRAKFITAAKKGLKVGIARLSSGPRHDKQSGDLIICGHIDHPYQANDGLSGVAVAVEIARRLVSRPLPEGSSAIRFLFCPETIGSICYLSHHKEVVKRLKAGIFIEMAGNRNSLVLQKSWQGDHKIDRIARYVLRRLEPGFREGAFLKVVGNDEKVINGPGVDVPCISISRYPYKEYHTSADNMDIIHEDRLQKTVDVVEEIARIFASDYIPRRKFTGPAFLTRYGLWVSPKEDAAINANIYLIMQHFDGKNSVFNIAEKLDLEYWKTRDYIERFIACGLVSR
ncbi:MAG: DUF4910 domain-containing protein [Candidatus Omnitrophica bacterium]|nr:DUF4910 domain-containing protein [Candidatus Omnitrophota bacterium]MBU1808083.1 DUF4910 domain-containing protein [Candidatus Omnitrophota bacterium]